MKVELDKLGPAKRAVATLATFVLAGPPIGALIIVTPALVGLAGDAGPDPGANSTSMQSFVGLLVFSVSLSYVLGGVQALLTGLALAAAVFRRGTVGVRDTLTAALGASAIASAVILLSLRSDPASEGEAGTAVMVLALSLLSLAAALVCRWLLARLGVLSRLPHPDGARLA